MTDYVSIVVQHITTDTDTLHHTKTVTSTHMYTIVLDKQQYYTDAW